MSQLPQGPLRIRTEDLDLLDVNGQLVCYNTRTLDRVAVPSPLAPLLRTYLDGPEAAEVLAHEAVDPLAHDILPLFLASAACWPRPTRLPRAGWPSWCDP